MFLFETLAWILLWETQGQDINTWVKKFYLELKANPEIEFSGLGMGGLQESADPANGLCHHCFLNLAQAVRK